MKNDIDAALEMIIRCVQLREQGRSEAVLRHEFTSRLRLVFPERADDTWVNHYAEGTETTTRIQDGSNDSALRFIDTLVNATVTEFEPDLRGEACFNRGYQQVREYVAGELRAGMSVNQVRGVLTDTVDWFVYDIALTEGIDPLLCQTKDVGLKLIDELNVQPPSREAAERLVALLRKHFARERSRPVTAQHIVTDFGLESPMYGRHRAALSDLVTKGRQSDPSVDLATDLWARFVDHFGSEEVSFRTGAYVDEAYVVLLARLLSANILEQQARMRSESELEDVLSGRFFVDRFDLRNMVEQDYFGWMIRSEYLPAVLKVAKELQRDLYAYDFYDIRDEDLFGHLMTQLASQSNRELLGQQWTPQWVADALAERCLELVPRGEQPRVIDMCCGSGAIIAAVLRVVRRRNPNFKLPSLLTAVTGFDIDPLAVLLAKTTWVVALANEIRTSSQSVTIPIYHADSLFAVTPTTRAVPISGSGKSVPVELYNETIQLPAELISPEYQPMFDEIVDWAYDEAREAEQHGNADSITIARAATLVGSLSHKHQVEIDEELEKQIEHAVYALSRRMAELAVAQVNGIWAFILRNTYRPGLLAGQFNGLVSNPPWLAMSRFADNPYKEQLSARAQIYGLKPGGAAHLHLELATTHLIHAVDRYLRTGAAVACLVPGTVFKGQHHSMFHAAAYLEASRPVPFELREVWKVAAGTFRVPGAVMIGVKRESVDHVDRSAPSGADLTEAGLIPDTLELRTLGMRTAWVLGGTGRSMVEDRASEVWRQGADLMPRTAVCVVVDSHTGAEWQVHTPRRGDDNYFAVRDGKKLLDADFPGRVAPQFLHRMLQSLNLLPFVLDDKSATVALPASRGADGKWEVLELAAIRTLGFRDTARRFGRINEAMQSAGMVQTLQAQINMRNKLSAQVFEDNRYLVVYGAGGAIACAGWLPISTATDIVIDQTLYWNLVTSEEEAWYLVGMLNSDILSIVVRDFNPPGEFGPRHLHTLPARMAPRFDRANPNQMEIARLAAVLAGHAMAIATDDARVSDPSKRIANRRRIVRQRLQNLDEFERLDAFCSAVLAGEETR